AVAATDQVWAVGFVVAGGRARSLIERWDGTAWTRVADPLQPPDAALDSVFARGPRDVWAVGTTSARKNLVLRWDGQRWRHPFDGIAAILNDVWVGPAGDVW